MSNAYLDTLLKYVSNNRAVIPMHSGDKLVINNFRKYCELWEKGKFTAANKLAKIKRRMT